MLAFSQFLHAATGVGAGSLDQVQIPLAELFLWVQVLHSLDVPARRDLLFSLVSSLVLMAVAGVLSISLSYGVHLLIWAPAALAALVLAHRSELRDLPSLSPPPDRAHPHAPRSSWPARSRWRSRSWPSSRRGAFLLVPAAGAARAITFPAALPHVVPSAVPGGLSNPSLGDDDPARPSHPGRGGGTRASFGYFGFSTSLDTAVRGRPDNTLVMRVRSSAPDRWRGQTFDRWDGRRWTTSPERPRPFRGPAPLDLPIGAEDSLDDAAQELVQTFYVARPGPNLIFGAYVPSQLYFPDRGVFQLSDGTIRAGVELQQGAVYTVVSRRPPVTAAALRQSDTLLFPPPPSLTARYLQLPATPERVRALAASVTASAPTRYDKVRALERWMAIHTEYSLDVPALPAGADAVDNFLFVTRKGFCEQIGSSLVVMLRSLGIPARLAVGYAPGERNPFTGLYEVRAERRARVGRGLVPGCRLAELRPHRRGAVGRRAGPSRRGRGPHVVRRGTAALASGSGAGGGGGPRRRGHRAGRRTTRPRAPGAGARRTPLDVGRGVARSARARGGETRPAPKAERERRASTSICSGGAPWRTSGGVTQFGSSSGTPTRARPRRTPSASSQSRARRRDIADAVLADAASSGPGS